MKWRLFILNSYAYKTLNLSYIPISYLVFSKDTEEQSMIRLLAIFALLAFISTKIFAVATSDYKYWYKLYEQAMQHQSEAEIVAINKALDPIMNSPERDLLKGDTNFQNLALAFDHFSTYMRFSNRAKPCNDSQKLDSSILSAAMSFDFERPLLSKTRDGVTGLNPAPRTFSCEDKSYLVTALGISDFTAMMEKAQEPYPGACDERLVLDIKKQALANAVDSLGRLHNLRKNLITNSNSPHRDITLQFNDLDDKAFGKLVWNKLGKIGRAHV